MQVVRFRDFRLVAIAVIAAAAVTYLVMATGGEPVEAISTAQGKCATNVVTSVAPAGSKAIAGLNTTIDNGDVSRRVIAQLSADAGVDVEAEIRVSYSIDGGPPQENVFGPANFANAQEFTETRSTMAIIPLDPGVHTIRPFWRVSGVNGKAAALEERCFTVEGRTS